MGTVDEVARLVTKAEEYALDGIDAVRSLGMDAIAAAYNGTGAEWMGEALRHALDKLSEVFLPAILIHDCDYAYSDGTMLSFQRANNRLEYNMLTIADSEYAWYNPIRYLRRRQARLFAEVCRVFGIVAYASAFEQHTKDKRN